MAEIAGADGRIRLGALSNRQVFGNGIKRGSAGALDLPETDMHTRGDLTSKLLLVAFRVRGYRWTAFR